MAGYYYDRGSVAKSGPEGWGYSDSPRDKAADRYGYPAAILRSKEEPTPTVRDFMNSVQNAAWCSSTTADERRMGFPRGMFQRPRDDRNGAAYIINCNQKDSNVDTGATGWERGHYGNGHASAGRGTPLSRVTNDAGAAANYVRESARPPATETATSRWGFGSTSGAATIDSTEAAKKYSGYFM